MLPGGSSTWLSEGTSFGDRFGSSRGHQYISLRPATNGADGEASVTTYSFADPTVPGTWGFAVGDIDAEILSVSAVGANGEELSADQLGFVEAFNYCEPEEDSPCSAGQPSTTGLDVTEAGTVVDINEPLCPGTTGMCDTAGSAGWFSPTVPISTLTITAAWKSGLPTYQTWFATAANSLSATLTLDCAVPGALGVELVDADGSVVDEANVAPGVEFTLGPVLARSDYRLRVVDAESNPIAVSLDPFSVDLSEGDVAGRALQGTTQYSIRGLVDGLPPDAPIAIAVTDVESGDSRTVPAEGDGSYTVDGVPSGTYDVRVTEPDDVTFSPAEQTVEVACADATAESIVAAASPTPTPTASPTPEPSPTPTPTPTASPTPDPTLTPEPTPTAEPSPSPTSDPSPSPAPAPSPDPSSPPGALAPTGADVVRTVTISGLLLLLLGFALVAATRAARKH